MENSSLPVLRSASISVFLDQMYSKLADKSKLSKDELREVLQKCSETHTQDFKIKLLKTAKAELKSVEEEYETLSIQHKKLQKQAARFAKSVVRGAFCVAAAQLFGYGYLIYGVFSWDEIEPITYLTSAFYACVSMGFYMRYRDDFEWASAYEVFYNRKLIKLKARQFDSNRYQFLKMYKSVLE